uniref:Pseudouridine synthase RsuA/RluA-like domain-containing protein n=3 Tax=Kalanchoe fedtschenkoi TaxID=63787 RepID=A0A7N0RHQ0_KALFE
MRKAVGSGVRNYSRVQPPRPLKSAAEPVIRVSNNVARLSQQKEGPKPRQLMSLPPFPDLPLPGRKPSDHVTAISWIKYYFFKFSGVAIHSHFNKGLVQVVPARPDGVSPEKKVRKISPNDVMEAGARVFIPVSVAESRVSKRFDCIPSATLYPNADEIRYLQRLVLFRDSAIIVLNKPPKLPVKGNLPVHNSMDALAAAALSYDYEEGPQMVHRLDKESSGIILMGRTKDSTSHLQMLFRDMGKSQSRVKVWSDACRGMSQKYWALVIGAPKEKEGLIDAPLTKVLLDEGKTERVILAHISGLELSQKAVTEYRVLGPTINGCSWIELRPLTCRKHQLRVHCAEALGTPIVGDYKYGWFVHKRWKQTRQVDVEPISGKPYKLRRPEGIEFQKGSVLSKVPLLHLHCRELVLPNIAKFLPALDGPLSGHAELESFKPDHLRFVASMPSHMKISWNLMSSYLV